MLSTDREVTASGSGRMPNALAQSHVVIDFTACMDRMKPCDFLGFTPVAGIFAFSDTRCVALQA